MEKLDLNELKYEAILHSLAVCKSIIEDVFEEKIKINMISQELDYIEQVIKEYV